MKQRYKKFVATLTAAATALAVVGLGTVINDKAVAPAQAATINVSGLKSLTVPDSVPSEDFVWNVGPNELYETSDEAMAAVWQLAVTGGMGNGQNGTPAYILPTDSMTFVSALAGLQVPIPHPFPGTYTAGWQGVWSPKADYEYFGIMPNDLTEWQPDEVSFSMSNLTPDQANLWMQDGKEYLNEKDVCPTTIQPEGLATPIDVVPAQVGSGNADFDAQYYDYVPPHTRTIWNAWCWGAAPYAITINKADPTDENLMWHGKKFSLDYDLNKMAEDFPGNIDGSPTLLSGPEDSDPGRQFQSQLAAAVLDPSLQVIKQVCVTYKSDGTPDCDPNSTEGWVADDTAGDVDGESGVLSGVQTGVEEGQIPPGTTQLLWKITAINNGNVPLTGVHVGADEVSFQPSGTSSIASSTCDGMIFTDTYQKDAGGNPTTNPLGVGNFTNLLDRNNVFGRYAIGGLGMISTSGALLPTQSLTQMCTTVLEHPFTGTVQNSVGLNAYFDNPSAPIFNSPDAISFDENGKMITNGQAGIPLYDPSKALMYRFTGYGDEAGQVPSNIDSAQVTIPEPGLKVTKWVCDGDHYGADGKPGCVIPVAGGPDGADAALSQMAGISTQNDDGTWTVIEGHAPATGPYAGWVKAATVPYESTAQFLIIITNVGNTILDDVTFDTEDVTGFHGTPGAWTQYPASDATSVLLQSGESATFTITADPIINMNAAGCFYGDEGCAAEAPSDYYDHASAAEPGVNVTLSPQGERPYAAGDDVVNTVVARGVPVNPDGSHIPGNDEYVYSNPSTAEARTGVPNPALKLTKWVCYTGTGCDYNLSDDQLALLTGVVVGTRTATQSIQDDPTGERTNGWVPETYVSYGTGADWLLIAVNIGNATLSMDDPNDSMPGSALHGAMSDIVPVASLDQSATVTVDGATVKLLSPGGHIVYALSTQNITNLAKNEGGFENGEWSDEPWNEQDRINNANSVINEAYVTGTVWDVIDNKPVVNPDNEPMTVRSNTSNVEVNSISVAIGDYVWDDSATAAGIQPDAPQNAHSGVPGVRVDLLHEDGSPVLIDPSLPATIDNIQTTTTDSTGFYHFDMLKPDWYRVAFYLPAGYTWTESLATTGGEGEDFDYAAMDSDAVYSYASSAVPLPGDIDTTSGSANPSDLIRVSQAIDLNVTSLADYASLDHVVKTADADMPARYKDIIQALFINPTVDAGVIHMVPDLKVTKWVCTRVGSPCDDPSAPIDPANPTGPTVLDSLAGYDREQGLEIAGVAAGGWDKEVTVPSGTDAQWLIVVTNTGDTILRNVTLNDDLEGTPAIVSNGRGATGAVDPPSVDLNPGEAAAFTLTTQDITNNNDVIPGIDEDGLVNHGEPTYLTGSSSVVNTVQASGEPWGYNAQTKQIERLTIPGSTQFMPNVVSNISSAEVNAIGFAIGDYMWIDANENGQQDEGETPVKNMQVSLYTIVDGQQTGTPLVTRTDDNGFYLFDNLPAGSYQVVFTLRGGYVWTSTREPGVDVALNSDADQVTGQSEIIDLGLDAAGVPLPDSNIRLSSEMDYPVNAKWINPTIDAGIHLPQPGIKITKWVCTDFTDGCADPAGADLVAMAGYDADGVKPGEPRLGWDKETTAPDETTQVDWLIVVTNTGKQTLKNVTLSDDYSQSLGAGELTCADATPARTLAPGQSTVYHCTTDNVTNTQLYVPGLVEGSTPDPIFGEPQYEVGDDVVNAAQATGNPVDAAGNLIPQLDENDNPVLDDEGNPVPVVTQSNVSEAEVNVVSYAVGDYVWFDANEDGLQDPTETGVEGVTVNLFRASDNTLVGTTTTDEDGWYHFDLLNSGSYYIQFQQENGYLWTKYLVGENPTIDSDAIFDQNTDSVATSNVFVLNRSAENVVAKVLAPLAYRDDIQAAYINPTIDAGLILANPAIDLAKYVCVTGTGCVVPGSFTSLDAPSSEWVKATTVSYDTDADWLVIIQNTGNVPLQDVNLVREDFDDGSLSGFNPNDCAPAQAIDFLAPGAFVPWTCTATHVTNTAALDSGQDVVNTAQAEGTPVYSRNHPLRNPDGSTRTVRSKIDKAEVRTDAFAVGDYVWLDANGDGLQDPTEIGVEGVTVILRDANNTVVATTTTDENGWYHFDLLKPGAYNIQFQPNDDRYLWTLTRQGTDTTIDSDAGYAANTDPVATSLVFTLGIGEENVVPTSEAPEAYRDQIKATYINPTIDAGLILATPGIALSKYVCVTGTDCATLADYVSLDAPNSEWVKQTTVTYNTSADWLILIQNTGNVTLNDVGLAREDFLAGGEGFDTSTCVRPSGAIQDTLAPGQVISWECRINNVTNTEKWETNEDIVNTAQAVGTPVYSSGPAHNPDGTPRTILSREDFAEVNTEMFAVGDYVWIDDGDGQQQSTETGLADVTVNLLDKDKNQIGTTQTDSHGYYFFDKLVPGDYQVEFVLPDGYMWTQYLNGEPTTDSDAVFTTDNFDETAVSEVFTLGKNEVHVVPVSEAPDDYRALITVPWINPTIDAGVIAIAPNIELKKFVCDGGTGCPTDVASIGSFANPQGGWVERTTVLYDGPAQWLVLVANTGNVDLQNVNLILEDLNVGGTGFTGTCDIPTNPMIALLPVGGMVSYTCEIDHVTNTAAFDSGNEIINEAQAEGTPVDKHGHIVHKPGNPPGPIQTDRERARVHTTPPASNPPTEEPTTPPPSTTPPPTSSTTPPNNPTTPPPSTTPPPTTAPPSTTPPPTTPPPTTAPPSTTPPPNNPTTTPPPSTTPPPTSVPPTTAPPSTTPPPNNPPTTPPPTTPPPAAPSGPSTPPPASGIGTGGSAQSQNGWVIPLFLIGVTIAIGALATRKHAN